MSGRGSNRFILWLLMAVVGVIVAGCAQGEPAGAPTTEPEFSPTAELSPTPTPTSVPTSTPVAELESTLAEDDASILTLLQTPTPSASEVGAEAQQHFELAEELFDQGKVDEAIVKYTEAIRFDPQYASAYVARGLAYQRSGRVRPCYPGLWLGHPP